MLWDHPAVHVFSRGLLSGDFLPLRDLIERTLPRDRRTLDLGCGPGIYADLFAPSEYVGVDPNPRFIDHARRTRPGIFLLGELKEVPLPEGRFDQALIVERLHSLGDSAAREVLAEARRLLVPGGRLLVVERARGAPDLLGRLREYWGRRPRRAEEYERLLRTAGRPEGGETLQSGTAHYLAARAVKE